MAPFTHLQALFSSDWVEVPRKGGYAQADSHTEAKRPTVSSRETHSPETERDPPTPIKIEGKGLEKSCLAFRGCIGVQCLLTPWGLSKQPAQQGSCWVGNA